MRRLITGIVVGLAFLPAASSAITIQELTDQIAVLLAQVAELQQKVVEASANEKAQATISSTATPAASVALSCPAIVRTLSRGQRGDDVLQLQTFLIAQKFLSSDSATGFYGPATESAVKQWQSGHSVVSSGSPDTTGWGTVGTRTRAAIRSACGDTSVVPTNDYLSVSSLGLSANMKLIVNAHGSCAAYEYTLNFGDGTDTKSVFVPADSCHPIELSVVHAYASGGNYTVTLSSGRGTVTVPVTLQSVATTGNECRAPQFATDTIPAAFVNTAWTLPLVTETPSGLPAVSVDGLPAGISLQKQIQVSGQTGISSNAWVLSGAPVQTGTYSLTVHMENACGKADRTITLPVSSEKKNECPLAPAPSCSAGIAWLGSDSNGCSLGYQCASVSTGGAPVITGVDGPATLTTGQQGTWTVRASVPNQSGASIRYSVVWGDEGSIGILNAIASGDSLAISTSGTFTHAYSSAGIFRPAFTVKNDSGYASFTTSVQVSGDGLLRCPIYATTQSEMLVACPAGQHWVAGTPAYDSNGCLVPGKGSCVPDSNSIFSASPTSGAAPLTVTFSTMLNTGFTYGMYVINYGDGASEKPSSCFAPADGCVTPGKNTHTYATAGTYTASLRRVVGAAEVYNGGDTNLYETIGAVTVTVGGDLIWACPQYQRPICPAGEYLATRTDSNGCSIPYCAVGDSGATKCKADLADANTYLTSQPLTTICGQGGGTMVCPYDGSEVQVLSTCTSSYLRDRGWWFQDMIISQDTSKSSINLASALSALEAALKKLLVQ